MIKLVVGKQVSDRETQGQSGNSAENRVENGHIKNSWLKHGKKHAFWKGKKKRVKKGCIFQRDKKGGESIK